MTEKKVPSYVKALAGISGGVIEAIFSTTSRFCENSFTNGQTWEIYINMFDCISKVSRREGFTALYKGLTPLVTHSRD